MSQVVNVLGDDGEVITLTTRRFYARMHIAELMLARDGDAMLETARMMLDRDLTVVMDRMGFTRYGEPRVEWDTTPRHGYGAGVLTAVVEGLPRLDGSWPEVHAAAREDGWLT